MDAHSSEQNIALVRAVGGDVAAFRCTDAAQQAAALPGWNQSYRQLSAGMFSGEVVSARLAGAHVFLESASRSLLQHGRLDSGAIGLAVPMRLPGPARFSGYEATFDQVCVYSGPCGFEFCSPADHQVAGIALSPDLVARLRVQAGHPAIVDELAATAHVRNARPESLEALRRFVVMLLQSVQATPALLDNAHTRAALRDSIIGNVCDLLASGSHAASAPTKLRARWRVVERARALVDSRPREPITVAVLCDELAISRRALQYCFQDALGVSPATYLRVVRLNGARAALGSAQSVTEAALDWGFWHLGQFAHDYRLMFDEPPSQTFRRFHPRVSTIN